MESADALYKARDFSEAEKFYREVLNMDPNNYRANLRVAKCNQYLQNYNDAIQFYEAAIGLKPKGNDTTYFELGICYKILERYNDALEVLEKFKVSYPLKDEYYKRAKVEIDGCKWAEGEKQKDPQFVLKDVNFNSSSLDMFPSLLNQNGVDSFIVFTTHKGESKGLGEYGGLGASYSDLWQVKMEDDTTFGVPENLGKKVNTKNNDGSSAFSPDGLKMYYTICNSGKLGYGCSIYESEYDPEKKAWQKAKQIEGVNGFKEVVVNSRGKTKKVPTYDVQPTISSDGNTMFFVSDRDGGWGKLDIWYSTFDGENWSEPINAGPTVNTPFDDVSPYISKSSDKLYYSSDGRKGFGGRDIFYSEGEIGNWGEPINLGYPINSSFDDYAAIWLKEDTTVMFTSNRNYQNTNEGTSGKDDIFMAVRKPKPPFTVAIHGQIRDKKSKRPVPFAEAILYIIETDANGEDPQLVPLDTFKTDQNAEYNFPLEANREYKIIANAPEYLANEENFNTNGLTEDTDLEKNIDIFLERIEIDVPIVLNHIYYDFDKSDLRPESEDELNKLIHLLSLNSNIKIEIGSHTDSNGSEDYNKSLSERRAASVVKYLVENGVKGERLTWYGYGESQLLIYPELSDEDEQINRRSEFRIKSIQFE
ncbi:MAG: OmpA family protein [Bacteroidia bacterium]|nr:OmpA family protein [Bacteroidia bacterium]